MHDLNDERYVLVLVGDGECRKEIEDKIKKLSLEKKVYLLGNRTDVPDLLQALDIFVFPSLFEGIPMALIEAQAVGIPVIASNTINPDIKINDNISFLSLDENNAKWITEINKRKSKHVKCKGYSNVSNSAYNIKNSAEVLKELYK